MTTYVHLLAVMLLAGGCRASHFYGTTMTFEPDYTSTDGTLTINFWYKLGFHGCQSNDRWTCESGDCGNETSLTLATVDELDGEWCQREGVMVRQVSDRSPFSLRLSSCCWINNLQNGISNWRALTYVDMRTRSDTMRANRSPQTTVLPRLRVASNCPRTFDLLAFDPDGDRVSCRFGSDSRECNPCTPPSVLSLHPSCTLVFNGTTSASEVSYAVQMMVEDFAAFPLFLGNSSTSTEGPLSQLPLQFVLTVEKAIPSCVPGEFLPNFTDPTPANGAFIHAALNQTLEIRVRAEATNSMVTQLLVSGPSDLVEGPMDENGTFTIRWMPSLAEDGRYRPMCFVVQVEAEPSARDILKLHSDLRCVIIGIGSAAPPVAFVPGAYLGTNVRLSSDTPLTDSDLRDDVLLKLKEELARQGVEADIRIRLVRVESERRVRLP